MESIEKLKEKLNRIDEKVEDKSRIITDLRIQINNVEEEIWDLRNKRANIKQKITKLENKNRKNTEWL